MLCGEGGGEVSVGRIPDEDVQRVREATDLAALVSETVILKKKGRLLWGNCPFHSEKTPSFKVDPATQLFHCFGCGAGGDAFGYLMRTENLEFPDAIRVLAERARIEIREEGGSGLDRGVKNRLLQANEAAVDFYHRALVSSKQQGAVKARDYLATRGFGLDVAKRFRLGYAPGGEALVLALREKGFRDQELQDANLALPEDRGGRFVTKDRFYNRIMFPIVDVQGHAVGFGGRVLGEGHPKYLNTGETPVFHKSQNLYGIHAAKNEIVRAGIAVVVEGYTDVIALHEAGIGNAVATLGTALTPKHVRLLSRFNAKVVYLFDGDVAGVRAALRAAELVDWAAVAAGAPGSVEMLVALIPEGRDPADWVAERGADAMREVIASATPLLRFVLDERLASHDLGTMEGRSAALSHVAGALAAVRGSMLEHEYANYVADRLQVHVGDVQRRAAKAKPDLGGVPEPEEEDAAASALVAEALLPEERAARELVGMLATYPELRAEARELLSEGVLASPVYERLVKEILSSEAAKEEIAGRVAAADPEAAALLSGALLGGVSESAGSTLRALLTKLKESGLERRILAARAAMKTLDPERDREEQDRLFREAASLQKELDASRRGRETREHKEESD
ncbi:MAG: DNA primase [Coriobacteriaceae bacterium]|nr:DNA primase [Coriobacteriaceae bacterium]